MTINSGKRPKCEATVSCEPVRVAVNEFGRRVGETHHNATIPDAVVDQIRDRHEEDKWGYLRLSQEFTIALTTVRKICTYERRAQTPERWKTIRVPEETGVTKR